MDETYLGMIFRPMGSCGKNFSSLGVVVTLRPEAYFFGGYHIHGYIFFQKNLIFPQAGFSEILKLLTYFFC